MLNRIKLFIRFGLICSILAPACSTTEKDSQKSIGSGIKVDDYLKEYWQKERPPWPSRVTVWEKYVEDNELIGAERAYELWDFNGDGRVDMVQKLNSFGQPVENAYDFDLDGSIDATAQVKRR